MTCLLCGSTKLVQMRSIQTAPLCDRWKAEFGIDITNDLPRSGEIQLMRCLECSLEFYIPFSPASPEIYQQLATFEWYYQDEKWEYQRAMTDLRGRSPAVEVGSGNGYFVNKARQALSIDLVGIETNQKAIEFAEARGWPVHLASVSDMAARLPGSLQAVCCFQVLEHLEKPREFLQSCCDLLVPGGCLILAVPNRDGFQFRLDLLLDMPPHHMTIYSKAAFESLYRYLPLELDRVEYEPLSSYHVGLWVKSKFSIFPEGSFLFRVVRKIVREFLNRVPSQHLIQGMGIYATFIKQ